MPTIIKKSTMITVYIRESHEEMNIYILLTIWIAGNHEAVDKTDSIQKSNSSFQVLPMASDLIQNYPLGKNLQSFVSKFNNSMIIELIWINR